MALAFLTATRSPDAETKHGSVVVDDKNRVLGTGFNGFPRGCKDDQLPKQRPGKYPFVVHAEINALVNCRHIPSPETCTIYITGEPCNECFKTIIQYGIGRIVYGGVGSNCIDANSQHAMVRSGIQEGLEIKVEKYAGDITNVINLLHSAANYADKRVAQNAD